MTRAGQPAAGVPESLARVTGQLRTAGGPDGPLTADAARTATVLDGGMEDPRSAYLVLALSGHVYLLLERRNDDGEFAPLLYPGTAANPAGHGGEYRAQAAAIREYAQELTREQLVSRGVLTPAADGWDVGELLADLLFGFRDSIAPHALTP